MGATDSKLLDSYSLRDTVREQGVGSSPFALYRATHKSSSQEASIFAVRIKKPGEPIKCGKGEIDRKYVNNALKV